MRIHIHLHHLVHVKRFHPSARCHAYRVAHKMQRMMILQEFWILRKHRALIRCVAVRFQRHQTFLARPAQQLEHHLHRLQIFRFVIFRPAEDPRHSSRHRLQNVQRIGDQQRSNRRPAQYHQLRRLHQHLQVAVLHQVAAHHRAEHHHDPDDYKHVCSPLPKPSSKKFPPLSLPACMRTLYSFSRIARSPPSVRFSCMPASARRSTSSCVSPLRTSVPPIESVIGSRSPHHSIFAPATILRRRSAVLLPSALVHSCKIAMNSFSCQRPMESVGRSECSSVWPTIRTSDASAPGPCRALMVSIWSSATHKTVNGTECSENVPSNSRKCDCIIA